ncbi:hypothetical protein D3C78_1682210 [compost metagenome]
MFDVLGAILVGNQHGIGGIHDDEIFHTDQCGQAPVALHIVVAGLVHQHLTVKTVAIGIGLRQFAHRIPGADIAPTDVAGDRCHAL